MDFMNSTPKQRKEKMQKALDNTYCALMLYYDDDCNVKVCATAETGFEPQLLELLNTAAGMARNAVECSIV